MYSAGAQLSRVYIPVLLSVFDERKQPHCMNAQSCVNGTAVFEDLANHVVTPSRKGRIKFLRARVMTS